MGKLGRGRIHFVLASAFERRKEPQGGGGQAVVHST